MTVITIEKCKNAKVNTVKVGNKELFWIRIIDIQNGLGLKNMSDLVRKEIHGIFSTDKATNKQIKEYKRSLQEFFFFFNCYLADPRPTLGHSQGDSLTNPMLIAAFYLIRPEGHREPRNEVGSLSPAERLAGFEPGTFRF